jgi:hypothetical protein
LKEKEEEEKLANKKGRPVHLFSCFIGILMVIAV